MGVVVAGGFVRKLYRFPDGSNRILPDRGIGCQDCKRALDGLADQHPVERIPMEIREFRQVLNILLEKWQSRYRVK